MRCSDTVRSVHSDAYLFCDHSSRRRARRLLRRREHECEPHVPAVRPILVFEFLVAFDVEVALSCGAYRNDEPDLRSDAKYAGLEATDAIARPTVAADLIIGIAH